VGQHHVYARAVSYASKTHLHVLLNVGVVEAAADKALGVEDGVAGVHGALVLGSFSGVSKKILGLPGSSLTVTDETLALVEGDIRGGGAVALVCKVSRCSDAMRMGVFTVRDDLGRGSAQVPWAEKICRS
jgi:hypothetical protein